MSEQFVKVHLAGAYGISSPVYVNPRYVMSIVPVYGECSYPDATAYLVSLPGGDEERLFVTDGLATLLKAFTGD